MKPLWKQLATLYHDIIYMIKHKKLDPNGAELNFIKDPYTNEQKATTALYEKVNKVGYELAGETDFAARLDGILNGPGGYIERLEKSRSKTRPMTIYVMTNGRWHAGESAESTIDHQRRLAGNAIARAVDALERLHAMDKQVGIQFIRFGEDELGIKRLRYLDDQLPKEKERPLARDICDTTPANGNVWKMMLGSIDPYWDDDPD